RQPEGRGRVVRCHRGGAGPRPRDPRGTVRSRDHARRRAGPGRLATLFGTFAEVPGYPFVFIVFWGAAAFFLLVMARHLRVFAVARPSHPFANVPARMVGLAEYAFVQTKMFKDPGAAVMHAGIFWGFVLLTIGTANIVTGGVIQQILSIPFDGLLWAAIAAMQNIVAVIVLVAIGWAYLRRLVT